MIKKFEYKGKAREAYILEETTESIKGIDLSSLTEDLRKDFSANLLKIKEEPKEYLTPYLKGFRHFLKKNIKELEDMGELPD
jgi:hypothetical protein